MVLVPVPSPDQRLVVRAPVRGGIVLGDDVLEEVPGLRHPLDLVGEGVDPVLDDFGPTAVGGRSGQDLPGFGGVASTAGSAAVPAVVERRQLMAAYAALQVVDQAAMVAGPAVSGLVIGAVPLGWVYALGGLAYAVSALILARGSPIPPTPGTGRPGVGSVLQGLSS